MTTLNKLTLFSTLMLCSPILALAEEASKTSHNDPLARARIEEPRAEVEFKNLVDTSARVYASVVNGTQGKVPDSVLKASRCIAVIPQIMTGALVVGGSHGEGFASCKDSSGAWSQPAAISLNAASIGLQAGAKSTDLVLFMTSTAAEQALKRGSFEIGTDVSAVAGKYSADLDASKVGIVAYSNTDGVFAGAALTGGKIGKDESRIAEFYGRNVNYISLLENKISPDASGYPKKLTEQFPS